MLLTLAAVLFTNTVNAATSAEIKKQKEQTESKLNSIKQNINSLEQKKSNIASQISEKNNELVDLLVVIQVLEEDMANKEAEIVQAQADYDAAKAKEEEQYQAMKKRIQYLYEKGDTMYIQAFLEAESISDMLNKAEYVNEIYEYDRNLLTEYKATKEEVANLQLQLEQEKDEMVALEADYKEQQGNLEVAISNMKEQAADFESELSKAKEQAKSYQETIAAQAAQIKKLAAEEQKKAEAAKKAAEEEAKKKAASQTASTSGSNSSTTTTTTTPSAGSGTGGSIASYACQFIGNIFNKWHRLFRIYTSCVCTFWYFNSKNLGFTASWRNVSIVFRYSAR
jgi:peptidoglycan hydrolase CwlO-like protein